MQTSAPDGGAPSGRFTNIQGGHLCVGGGDNGSQDFIYNQTITFNIPATATAVQELVTWNLSDLAGRIRGATIWQTYKLNKITICCGAAYDEATGQRPPALTDRNWLLSIVPYSRNVTEAEGIDPRSILGCQSRFMHPVYSSLGASSVAPPQFLDILKVTNDKPLYYIDTSSSGNTSTTTYSSAAVTINTDTINGTVWNAFIMRADIFGTIATGTPVFQFRVPVMFKVNISFEGIKWSTLQLSLPEAKKIRLSDELEKRKVESSRYWMATAWHDAQLQNMISDVMEKDPEAYILVSDLDKTTKGRPHRHILIVLKRNRDERFFYNYYHKLFKMMPMEQKKETMRDSFNAYINYIKKKGMQWKEYGECPFEDRRPKRMEANCAKSDEILKKIEAGVKRKTLLREYSTMKNYINGMMEMRPSRRHETKCLHIYGPPGTGKTVSIMKVLRTIEKYYPELDFYSKGAGLKKWWQNYNNEAICVIDDPSCFNCRFSDEDVQAFKTVISSESMTVEIKGGNMQFDGYLVIVITNPSSNALAETSGTVNREAILDRLAGSRSIVKGGVEITDAATARERLPRYLTKIVARVAKTNFDIDVDVELIINNLPAIIGQDCSDIML